MPDATRPPSLWLTLTEATRALLEISTLPLASVCLAAQARGDGHPVLVLPGFMAGDQSTLILRRYLSRQGYVALPWGFGQNLGPRGDLAERMLARVVELHELYGEPITLVGQSLGGIYARQLARARPDAVRMVVTLGSPIGGLEGGTMRMVEALFEAAVGDDLERLRASPFFTNLRAPLEVPCSAIFSRLDGVASWRICMQQEGPIAENIEVTSSHVGMGMHPEVLAIVAERLSQSPGEWRRFSPRNLKPPTPDALLRATFAGI